MTTWTDLSASFAFGTKLTSSQVQQLRDNITAAFEKAGGAPVLANDYIVTVMITDGNVTEAKIASESITQGKVKISWATSTHAVNGSDSYDFTLPGGVYGLMAVQVKGPDGGYFTCDGIRQSAITSTYSYVKLRMSNSDASPHDGYVYQAYITSSGEVFWYMIMRDKTTKDIIAKYCGPDHPCMPQQKTPEEYPHPWVDEFDPEKHEIIVINPDKDMLEEIRLKREDGRTVLEVIEDEYELDEESKPAWPDRKITTRLPPEWERAKVGDPIEPIKEKIPRPDYIKTAALKLKRGGL